MSTEVGSIHYTLDLDKKDFDRGINEASSEVRSFSDSLKNAEKGSMMFAGALTAIAGAAVAATGFGVKIAGDLEAARQGFVALLGSAEKADATMNRIKEEAKATPFELTGLVAGTQALTAITKDGDKAVDILLDVGKAIATSGKGQAELDRVILNLQQISSTGKITAMDIRQFQSAIPMFNDIIEKAGLTTEELQNSSTAAEDLFTAFRKAGEEGGLTAAGFTAQAGTFNQLWSNFIDNITIGASELVKNLGIFDAVKNGLSGINEALSNISSPEGIERIKNILQELANNAPIVIGFIVGGLTPAFYALASGVIAAMAPLIPFIAAGVAIGAMVQLVVNHLGGWEAVQERINVVIGNLAEVYNTYIKPALDSMFTTIKNELLPSLQELWTVVSPILLPALEILAKILGTVIVASIIVLVNGLKMMIEWITAVVTTVSDGIQIMLSLWKQLESGTIGIIKRMGADLLAIFFGIPPSIVQALKNVPEAIIAPFRQAFDWIKEKVNGVFESLQKLNPFHRNSPSLVDNIQRGVREINRAFADLNVNVAPVANLTPEFGINDGTGAVGQQNITINIDQVGDMQDVDAIGREMGFRAGITPRMFEA